MQYTSELRTIIMDEESLRLNEPSKPTIWTRLAHIFNVTGNERRTDQSQICFKTNTLYLKNGCEIDLVELQLAVQKYKSIYNINSTATLLRAGFNKRKVFYFFEAVSELMESVLILGKEELQQPFIQTLLTDIVEFYDLHTVEFENRTNCYVRILKTSETIKDILQVDYLHL